MAEVESKSTGGPGKLLVSARDDIGLTQADISKQLNLPLSIIEQLDTDCYTEDIPDTFFRGYIRTYARLVELDGDKIVTLYSELIGHSEVSNHYVPSTDVAPMKIQIGSHLLWFKVLSAAVVLTILVLGWMAYSAKQEKSKTQSSELLSTTDNAISTEDLSNSRQTNNDLTITDKTIPSTESATQIIEATPVTEIPQGFINSASLTDGELDFTFLDDCWVQVIDSNGEVLAVGLKSAGRRFTINGVPPISVVLGKPRAISLQYNSEAVDLTIYPAAQTARFTLGEETET